MSLSDFLLVNGNGKRIENSRTVGKAKDRFLNRRAYQLIRLFNLIYFKQKYKLTKIFKNKTELCIIYILGHLIFIYAADFFFFTLV